MNFQEPGWHGELKVNATMSQMNGSVQQIFAQVFAALKDAQPRDGIHGKRIVITLQTHQFSDLAQTKLADEVESQISSNVKTPIEGESHDEFYDRLVSSGTDPNTAGFVAADWFSRPNPNPRLGEWLRDSRAEAFRKLNSSNKAFEDALPSEYESLKQYVLEKYPEFCEAITFRTA